MNVTLKDCIALSELTDEEIDAIAEHEHIPEIPVLRRMIVDDIAEARKKGDVKKLCRLMHVLRHFIETHPERHKVELG